MYSVLLVPPHLTLFLSFLSSGVTSEAFCPPGTFNPTQGGKNITDCLPCTAGKYCGTSGLSSPTGWCLERYYCPSDAEVQDDRPSEFECPAGHYCLNDTATPYACDPGMCLIHIVSNILALFRIEKDNAMIICDIYLFI